MASIRDNKTLQSRFILQGGPPFKSNFKMEIFSQPALKNYFKTGIKMGDSKV